MEGLVLWVDCIHAIRSQRSILWSTKLLGQPEKKKLPTDQNINVCEMKGLIVHPIICEHLCGILNFQNPQRNALL